MKNNIVTIILVILIGMVAFWYLTKPADTTTSYLSADVKTTNSADAKYIYTILQQMAQVNLDDSIFTNPTFQNLKDNTAFFSPQVSGRNNPFAPVGTDGQSTQSTTSLRLK